MTLNKTTELRVTFQNMSIEICIPTKHLPQPPCMWNGVWNGCQHRPAAQLRLERQRGLCMGFEPFGRGEVERDPCLCLFMSRREPFHLLHQAAGDVHWRLAARRLPCRRARFRDLSRETLILLFETAHFLLRNLGLFFFGLPLGVLGL